jgi:hypothetical protein
MPACWPTVSDNVDNSPMKYSIINSAVPRFRNEGASLDLVYDTNTSHKSSLTKAVADSARAYKNMTSTVPRMRYSAPDNREMIDYNVAHKKDMSDMVAESPITYSSLRTSTQRFAPKASVRRVCCSCEYPSCFLAVACRVYWPDLPRVKISV